MNEEEYIDYLLEVGALYKSGVSEDGSNIMKMDSEKMKEFAPELYQAFLDDLEESLMELYEKGLIDVEYNENLEAQFSISELGKNLLSGAGLDPDFFRHDSI